jgi:hypothetical protein
MGGREDADASGGTGDWFVPAAGEAERGVRHYRARGVGCALFRISHDSRDRALPRALPGLWGEDGESAAVSSKAPFSKRFEEAGAWPVKVRGTACGPAVRAEHGTGDRSASPERLGGQSAKAGFATDGDR